MSTMSMSIASQASSDSFFIAAAAAELRPKKTFDEPRKNAQQAVGGGGGGVDVVRSIAAVPRAEEQHGECCSHEAEGQHGECCSDGAEGQHGECCSGGAEGNDGNADDVSGEKIVSHEEITRHRREGDAWIVVDGKVYDVTHFLEVHPGGAEVGASKFN